MPVRSPKGATLLAILSSPGVPAAFDDAEDTVRFYALRLHEAGMIKSDPNTIIAKGTDWRFLNELKRELKA